MDAERPGSASYHITRLRSDHVRRLKQARGATDGAEHLQRTTSMSEEKYNLAFTMETLKSEEGQGVVKRASQP